MAINTHNSTYCIYIQLKYSLSNTCLLLIDVSKKYASLFVFMFIQRVMPVLSLHDTDIDSRSYTATH